MISVDSTGGSPTKTGERKVKLAGSPSGISPHCEVQRGIIARGQKYNPPWYHQFDTLYPILAY